MSHLLTKSSKGLREANGKTQDLPAELREVLKLCKGQFVAEQLVASCPPDQQESVASALLVLTETGYLREVAEVDLPTERATEPAPVIDGVDTDEVAQQLRAEMAARRGQRDDEDAELVRQAAEAARQRAAEKARQEAEERARHEAEERARREAEARARIEAEEKARLATLERERAEAEEKARREAAERTRRAAEEKAKREAAERAKREAEEKARREAEERELEEMRERIRQRGIRRRRVILPTVLAAIGLPALVVWGIGHVPMEGKRKEFAAKASEMLGTPVSVGEARFVLLPKPHWQLIDLQVGKGAAQARAGRLDIDVPLTAVWSLPAEFGHLHVTDLSLSMESFLGALDAASGTALAFRELTGKNVVITQGKPFSPPLEISVTTNAGQLASVTGSGNTPEEGKFSLSGMRQGEGWQIDAEHSFCTVPFGMSIGLTDCKLNARYQGQALTVSEFTGRLRNGDVVATGILSWKSGWESTGNISFRRVDGTMLAPEWFRDGFIDGSSEYDASATSADGLYAGMRLAGKFRIAPGTLNHVDIDRLVQGRGGGEQQRFESLEGALLIENGKVDFPGITLTAGALVAQGSIAVESPQKISGRLVADVQAGVLRMTTPIQIEGTLARPEYSR